VALALTSVPFRSRNQIGFQGGVVAFSGFSGVNEEISTQHVRAVAERDTVDSISLHGLFHVMVVELSLAVEQHFQFLLRLV
jgi:hypothetical protein